MLKRQFTIFMISAILEAWFFADAVFSGYVVFVLFWGYLLVRKLRLSYKLDKAMKKSGLV